MGDSIGLPLVLGTAAGLTPAGLTVTDAFGVTAEAGGDGNGEPLDEHADRNSSEAKKLSAGLMGEGYD